MAVSINSNLNSLRVGRQLDLTGRRLSSTFEKLSSGLRINRASDDAAGLAVSSALTTYRRVLNQARQNVNDGISLLNVTDGATGAISDLLLRMNELSGQAANGTFSALQRMSLNQEYLALDQEIRRIYSSTSFNNINILSSGSFSTSSTVLSDGDGGLNSSSLGLVSSNGKYARTNVGLTFPNSIIIMDVDTQTYTTIDVTSFSPGVFGSDLLAISDDGVAIIEATNGGVTDFWTYDLNTGTAKQLTDAQTNDAYTSNTVALSADGNTLVFASRTEYEIV